MTLSRFYFDCENFLIAPSLQSPPIVCISYCIDDGQPQLVHAQDPRAQQLMEYALESCLIIGHTVSFDMSAVCAMWPRLTPLVFRAYAEDRAVCVETRQKLIDIAKGRAKGDKKLLYDLGSCSLRANGPVLDKSDPWRLAYGTLWGVPVDQWPEDARRYSLLDAEATRAVYTAQQVDAVYLDDQYRQARADFSLKLMVAWGFATDRAAAERYMDMVQKTLVEDRRIGEEYGLIRPDGTKNTKLAQEYMRKLCEAAGDDVPMTPGEAVSLSEQSVEEHGDWVLEAYQRYANANTRTKRAERLLHSPIQSRFDVLKNTGRTGCSQGDGKKSKVPVAVSAYGAQIQNVAKDKGFREVFVARPGCALVSNDYAALELVCWSQVYIWLFGTCRMADSINAGGDQHTELAARLLGVEKSEAYRLKKADPEFSKGPRFFSKMGNFGFLADMSAATFCKHLVKQTVHQGNPETIAKAKAFTEDEAKALKNAFNAEWGAQRYFAYVKERIDKGKALEGVLSKHGRPIKVASIEHFVSKRVRAGCYYTQWCNSAFQGLASDLTKDAMWNVSKEMYTVKSSPLYGARLVNSIHDELLTEIPLDRLHEGAFRVGEIMCASGRKFCPDMTFKAEPAAMYSWNKDSELVLKDGKLVPWTK